MIAEAAPALRGEHLKERAHENLQAHRWRWIRLGKRALLEILLERGQATADDIRPAVPLPDGISPKLFGAVPGPLAREGIIVAIGYAKSVRPEAHARPQRVWKLRDAAAAHEWLRNHPEPVPETETAGPL